MPFKTIHSFPPEILNSMEPPFISLYQPTHRHWPDNKQDPIRYKSLLKEIETSLAKSYSKREIEPIMQPFYTLAEDKHFWNNTTDGLAILASRNEGVLYKLERPVQELAVVADSFHIKPLIRVFQSADRYLLLGLNRNEFALYEGNRYGFQELKLGEEVPRTAIDALGEDDSEKYFTRGTGAGAKGVGAFHGHGGRKADTDKNIERFFRYVDRFVLENYSKPMQIPLILAALNEYHTVFRNISHNPYLAKEGIRTDFTTLSVLNLQKTVWETVEPLYLEKTASLAAEFRAAQGRFLGSDDLSQVVRAAWEGRVATLLLEADRIIPGKLDTTHGTIVAGDLEHPEFDDLLDDLAELVVRRKGQVVILPKERMPSDTGAAAVFRH